MDKTSITETKSINEDFNKNFTQIRLNLAKDIGTSTKSLTECINKHGNSQPEKVIPVNEFEDAFMQ